MFHVLKPLYAPNTHDAWEHQPPPPAQPDFSPTQPELPPVQPDISPVLPPAESDPPPVQSDLTPAQSDLSPTQPGPPMSVASLPPRGAKPQSAAAIALVQFAPLRVPQIREGRGPTHTKRNLNLEADLCQKSGTVREPGCTRCNKGAGPWTECVTVDGFLQESCANCHYSGAGPDCSFRAGKEQDAPPEPVSRLRRSTRQRTPPQKAKPVKNVVAAVAKDKVLPTITRRSRSTRLRSPSASPTPSPLPGSYPYSLSPRQLDNIRRRIRGSTPEAINPQAIRRPRGPIADFRALLIEARGLSASQISWRKAELQRELAALTQAEAELIDREVDDGEV